MLRDEQRLTRAVELHGCLCHVEPRPGSRFEFVFGRLQQALKERDVRFTRSDLGRRAFGKHVQARNGRCDVVLRLLDGVPTRAQALMHRLILPQRREVEELHRSRGLRVGDIERADDRRLSRQREAERLQIDRLVVTDQPRVGLRQQRPERLALGDARPLLSRSCQIGLGSRRQSRMNGVGERNPGGRLRICSDRKQDEKETVLQFVRAQLQ